MYVKNLFLDRYVASVTPTSHFAVSKICEKMDFSKDRLVVEYGPGTGAFTEVILNHMTPGSRLIAIERNHEFCRVLMNKIKDGRLSVFNQCAGEVLNILRDCNATQADYVLSGIPFSYFPRDMRIDLLLKTYAALKRGGKFLAYQTFYQPPTFLKVPLGEIFPVLRTDLAIFCFPPLFLYEAIKQA